MYVCIPHHMPSHLHILTPHTLHPHTFTPSYSHTLTLSQLVAQAVSEELQHEQGAASVEKVVNTDDENEV